MVLDYKMLNSGYDKILSGLEEEVSKFWTKQETVKTDKTSVSEYLSGLSKLSYFADENGNMLYKRNSEGQYERSRDGKAILDYDKIIAKNDFSGANPEEKKKSVDEAFKSANEFVNTLYMFSHIKGYSRFAKKFNASPKETTAQLIPNYGISLDMFSNISDIEKLGLNSYLKNSYKLLENIAPEFKAVKENLKSKEAGKHEKGFADFLELSKMYNASKGKKDFDIIECLETKIIKAVSAADKLDELENNFYNRGVRSSDSFARNLLPVFMGKEKDAMEKYKKVLKSCALKSLNDEFNTLYEKIKKNDEED